MVKELYSSQTLQLRDFTVWGLDGRRIVRSREFTVRKLYGRGTVGWGLNFWEFVF